jgi:hypothetical protein
VTDHKDYSGTPLWRKLGVREGARVLCTRAPEAFDAELERLAPLPPGVERLHRPDPRTQEDLDVVIAFFTRRAELAARFPALARAIAPDGRLWIAWPKKAAKLDTDLDFDAVQTIGLRAGLVDNKSASITDAFQGVQFVVRVRDRPLR